MSSAFKEILKVGDYLAENKNVEVNVSGITPVASGNDWFAIDETGTFSIDRSINATVWLVGGGCDGEAGTWTEETQVATGGKGGDGGYVYMALNVKIPKNFGCNTVIAEVGDRSGTALEIGGLMLRCNQSGFTSAVGGNGSTITGTIENGKYSYENKIEPTNGVSGISTPYQVIGSSGGGAMSCTGHDWRTGQGDGGTGAGRGGGHREEGNNATNHGCGGGGGDGCGADNIKIGHDGGKGMKGCIIVAYTIEEEPPTLIVQKHYKRVCNTHKTCNTDYYSSSSRHICCGSDNGSCGCGSGSGSNSNGVSNMNYTDSININSPKMNADALAAEIQNIETENLVLTRKINELENK